MRVLFFDLKVPILIFMKKQKAQTIKQLKAEVGLKSAKLPKPPKTPEFDGQKYLKKLMAKAKSSFGGIASKRRQRRRRGTGLLKDPGVLRGRGLLGRRRR